MTSYAHGSAQGHFLEQLALFGTDWLYVGAPLAVMLAIAALLSTRSQRPGGGDIVLRFADGAGRVSGLPAWCAATLLVLLGALVIAVLGFIWDVGWHIVIGRDEFLFSPPHVCLLVGLVMLSLAGVVGIWVATKDEAQAGWRVGRWHLPFGPTALVIAGGGAIVGFGIDELWHAAYGLDVTMWSPPHLAMISAAAFSGIAGVITYAEAGPGSGHRFTRRFVPGFVAGVALIALSAWQLEFDYGVPQWQMLAQAVLIAVAAGVALVAAREAIGRGGALIAVAHFLAVRGVLMVMADQVWNIAQPRFPLYLGSAIAVEAAFLLTRDRRPMTRALAAGFGVATFGLAGEWLVTHLWLYHPWQPRLLPSLAIAAVAAVASAVLGMGLGRAFAHRPTGMRWGAVALSLVTVLAAMVVALPRRAPQGTAIIQTEPAGSGRVHVTVTVDQPQMVAAADRWEIMSWQGGGRVLSDLRRVDSDTWTTADPVPATGQWKALVRYTHGAQVGGAAVRMPADEELNIPEVPLLPERRAPFLVEQELLLREAHDGPAWPGIVAYTFVATAMGALVLALITGVVALDRRRRGFGWRAGAGSLDGQRVVLTGATGGIGTAARAALEAQGAHVLGLDLVSNRPDTIAVDVTDSRAVAAAVDEAASRLGGIDVVIANAGIGGAADSTVVPGAAARRVLDVNLLGSWSTIAAALRHLPDGGRVIGITSGLASATVPYSAAYTASKRALSGYLDVLRAEAGDRWTVTEIQPAYIATAIHDAPAASGASLAGLVRCEDVWSAAAAVVTACETRRRAFGSSPLMTAEAWLARRAPGLVDRALRRRLKVLDRTRPRPTFDMPASVDLTHVASADPTEVHTP